MSDPRMLMERLYEPRPEISSRRKLLEESVSANLARLFALRTGSCLLEIRPNGEDLVMDLVPRLQQSILPVGNENPDVEALRRAIREIVRIWEPRLQLDPSAAIEADIDPGSQFLVRFQIRGRLISGGEDFGQVRMMAEVHPEKQRVYTV